MPQQAFMAQSVGQSFPQPFASPVSGYPQLPGGQQGAQKPPDEIDRLVEDIVNGKQVRLNDHFTIPEDLKLAANH